MKIVAGPGVRDYVETRGGAVYVWPHTTRCCRVRTITLEADTTPPDREFELVHAVDGFRLFAVPGFIEPGELELELGRRGKLSAYWNGQAWVG
jgi:hypothetical protein